MLQDILAISAGLADPAFGGFGYAIGHHAQTGYGYLYFQGSGRPPGADRIRVPSGVLVKPEAARASLGVDVKRLV